MTPRKAPTAPARVTLSPAAFPHLESFFSGYLHEDFQVEYGSPEGALRAWRMDATAKESQQLDREAARLLEAAANAPFDTVAAFVRRDLGSAWRPSSLARLQALFAPTTTRARR
jgi:CdiI immunity protein